MLDTSIKICDVVFDNPVVAASGTMGYGYENVGFFDINAIGSIVLPGCTMKPNESQEEKMRVGSHGILRSDVRRNPGVYRVAEEELQRFAEFSKKRAIAGVCGSTVTEMVKVAEILDRSEYISVIELDATLPNREKSGMPFSANATSLYKLTRSVKDRVRKPVFVKLIPAVTDLCAMALAVQDGGGDGLTLCGGLDGMRIDLATGKPCIGGDNEEYNVKYYDRAIKPVMVKNIYDVFNRIGIPIMAAGGVDCAEDVIEMMYAGASLVQIDSAQMLNPLACMHIIDQLPEVMEKFSIERLSSVIGKAH